MFEHFKKGAKISAILIRANNFLNISEDCGEYFINKVEVS